MSEERKEKELVPITKNYPLIKGDFSTEEAWEIISDLISNKVNFHERQSFSKLIRFGEKDETHKGRIEELNKIKEEVRLLVEQAKKTGKSLRVSSTISIELI